MPPHEAAPLAWRKAPRIPTQQCPMHIHALHSMLLVLWPHHHVVPWHAARPGHGNDLWRECHHQLRRVLCDSVTLCPSRVGSSLRSDGRLDTLMQSFSDTDTMQRNRFTSSSGFFRRSCRQSASTRAWGAPHGEAHTLLLLVLAAPTPTPARHVAAI